MSTTRTEERPITGRTVTIELPQAVAARFAQRSPLSSGRDERALIIACQDAVDPAPAIPVAHLDHDALIALAREEISSDRRPSVRPEQELDPERLLSPGEMARRWGISRAMVYDLLGEGCPSLKIGRARRLRVSDADAWLSERQAMTS